VKRSALTLTAVAVLTATAVGQTAQARTSIKDEIVNYRQHTWALQSVVRERLYRTNYSERWAKSPRYLRWVRKLWRSRFQRVAHVYDNPPQLQSWLCIHRYEGSWSDPGSPYYGGLQMDLGFQETYAPELLRSLGTADHWPWLTQIWVAIRAYNDHHRGFSPWPNTARYCGLIV